VDRNDFSEAAVQLGGRHPHKYQSSGKIKHMADMACRLSRGRVSFSRFFVIPMLKVAASTAQGHATRERMRRRWIMLISAGWFTAIHLSSRGCLALVSGIITRMPT